MRAYSGGREVPVATPLESVAPDGWVRCCRSPWHEHTVTPETGLPLPSGGDGDGGRPARRNGVGIASTVDWLALTGPGGDRDLRSR